MFAMCQALYTQEINQGLQDPSPKGHHILVGNARSINLVVWKEVIIIMRFLSRVIAIWRVGDRATLLSFTACCHFSRPLGS